jgi:3-phytase
MSSTHFYKVAIGFVWAASVAIAQVPDSIVVQSRVNTTPVLTDADDPAIWIHPTDPSKTLVIGTDKGSSPNSGLFTWNLDGTENQHLNINRPNNVDVRYGLRLNEQTVDIAAVSLRDNQQVRIYKIDAATRGLSDITTEDNTNVLNQMFPLPYGLALYKRQTDGVIFVIVSSRHSDFKNQLWQIRLEDDGNGRVKGALVREFGEFSNVVEGMVADDELGYFYAPEEKVGIHKYYADPLRGKARLTLLETSDSHLGNYEGLALYKCSDLTGYLLVSRPSLGCIRVYRREGEQGEPHQHLLVTTIRDGNAVAGDGLEVTNLPNGPSFPYGFLVWQNPQTSSFRLYGWEDIAKSFLKNCSSGTTSVEADAAETNANDMSWTLKQNYPNPLRASAFNPATEIRFVLKQTGPVQLTVYNVLGETVKHLLNATLAPGAHTIQWDARNDAGAPVGSGIYFYQLRADNLVQTRRMVLSR